MGWLLLGCILCFVINQDGTSPDKAVNQKEYLYYVESVTLCNNHETQGKNYNRKFKIKLLYFLGHGCMPEEQPVMAAMPDTKSDKSKRTKRGSKPLSLLYIICSLPALRWGQHSHHQSQHQIMNQSQTLDVVISEKSTPHDCMKLWADLQTQSVTKAFPKNLYESLVLIYTLQGQIRILQYWQSFRYVSELVKKDT